MGYIRLGLSEDGRNDILNPPEETIPEELIRINRSVRLFSYIFNNPLLMPACNVAGTVGNTNTPKVCSLASKELII